MLSGKSFSGTPSEKEKYRFGFKRPNFDHFSEITFFKGQASCDERQIEEQALEIEDCHIQQQKKSHGKL